MADTPTVGALALVSLDEMRAYLSLAEDQIQWDSLLVILIDSVSALAVKLRGRPIVKHTYSDLVLDGSGSDKLVLPSYPVREVTSITEDGVALTENTDYVVDYASGILTKLEGLWTRARGRIVITFDAGYVAIAGEDEDEVDLPAEMKLAVMKQVAFEWQTCKQMDWGESSRSFPDGSVTKRSEDAVLPIFKEVFGATI